MFSQSAWKIQFNNSIPAGIYLLKVNSKNTSTRYEICSKLTFKVHNKDTRTTSVSSVWCLYCKLWTYFTICSKVSIVYFKQKNVHWGVFTLVGSCPLPTDMYRKIKYLCLHPSHTTTRNVKSIPEWPILQKKLLKNSGAMGKWVAMFLRYYPRSRYTGIKSSD